jgi:CheY-like chemotaxis protein
VSLRDRLFVEEEVVLVKMDRHLQGPLRGSDAADMIDMRMRQQDAAQGNVLAPGECEQRLDFVAGVDQHAFPSARARHHESVLEERANCLRLDYDHVVILAILDDLLFTSKIKTTGKQLGVAISVARSRDGALAEMRAHQPSLVIFDLNNPRTDPLGIVAAMKADPSLAAIATVGFASHVQVEVIEAARLAGVDEVMARSMFTERLPQILARGR